MLQHMFFKIILAGLKTERVLLGRWGYHWETNKYLQKYYE